MDDELVRDLFTTLRPGEPHPVHTDLGVRRGTARGHHPVPRGGQGVGSARIARPGRSEDVPSLVEDRISLSLG